MTELNKKIGVDGGAGTQKFQEQAAKGVDPSREERLDSLLRANNENTQRFGSGSGWSFGTTGPLFFSN